LAAITSAGSLYLSYRDVSRLLFLLFAVFSYVFLLFWRVLYRLILRSSRLQTPHRNVLIIGSGESAQELRDQIIRHHKLGLNFIGFLDDQGENKKIVGYLSDARKIIAEKNVDDVVIALPGWAHNRISSLIAELHDLAVKVWVIPDYFSLTLYQAAVEEYAGIPMLDLRAPALSEYQRILKRSFDLLISFALLPFVLIAMLLITLAIRLDSAGPALLKQKRIGENGRIFDMLKFRTMVENAEALQADVQKIDQDGNLIHKLPNDPRVTSVGRILRQTSLDELPQIFNVLKGEMSLVGPRPEMPFLVDKYQPWQRKRFAVPQGITGWWQINGRSDRPMHLHTEDDLYYVQNYSLVLDISILLRTFWTVLTGRGAY
jgi:exopolysaccharide biosynthesis polyprenyl glycosylphosphotransferase